MAYTYDDQNIFAKILAGEIPCNKVAETDHSLAFTDIAPQAPHHVLVIPKGRYVSYDHFSRVASDAEIVDFTRLIGTICDELGITLDGKGDGFRLVSNAGADGVQDVPHLHVHILAGRSLGPMLERRTA